MQILQNSKTRIQFWLEMSLYELKFASADDSSEVLEDRMMRVLTIIQTIDFLISENDSRAAKEWLQRALFYTVELVGRILGTNLKDFVATITADLFSENSGNVEAEIRVKLKPILTKFLDVGTESVFRQNSEEFAVFENIRQCLKIFEYIEEEIDVSLFLC